MVPMGYLYRRVAERPEWLRTEHIDDIYSLHDCFTKDFADYIPFWKHNGFWVFDTPEIIESLAAENSISLDGMCLFYYEIFEHPLSANELFVLHPHNSLRRSKFDEMVDFSGVENLELPVDDT